MILKTEESPLYRAPLATPQWLDLLANLRGRIRSLQCDEIQCLIRRIREGIEWLDAPMSEYCALTCPSCEDPCCDGRGVFFNRTDLLYLTAMSDETPPGQTRSRPEDPCRYLGQTGCRLSRTLRPYVCVWFLCDAQMQLFQMESAVFQRRFIKLLQDIRASRLRLESIYELHYSNAL